MARMFCSLRDNPTACESPASAKRIAAEFEMDQSALIKKSIMDTYEDLIDRQVIEAYEKDEARKKPVFHSFEEIIKSGPNRKGK